MSNSCHMATCQSAPDASSTPASNSTPADSSLTAGLVPEASVASPATTTQTLAPSVPFTPGNPLHTMQYISDTSWPANLQLNHSKSNWKERNLHLTLLINHQGFTNWLHGLYPQPDATKEPKGHHVWVVNDCSLKVFILQHVSHADYKAISYLSTSSAIFNALCK